MVANHITTSAKPHLSIIICTYDRRDLLIKTLTQLETIASIEKCEVIIIENTSEPDKRAATKRLCLERFPTFKVIESETPGLSRARNLGLANAQSDLVAYLDDDAVPDYKWADALIRAFQNPDIVYAGGPIDPDWEIPPPTWLPQELYGAYTVLNLGLKDRVLRRGEFVYGANMAFHKSSLLQINGFDEHLGRVKSNLHGDEDIAVQRNLASYGSGYYAAAARVKHFVPKSRINWHWLVKRFAWQGFSEFSQHPTMQNFHLRAIDSISANTRALQFYDGLFEEPESQNDALARLNIIRTVLGNLYQGRDEISLVKKHSTPVPQKHELQPIHDSNARFGRSFSRYAFDSRKPVFVEFGLSHSYLMKTFGDIGPFEFLNPQFNPWKAELKAVSTFQMMRQELNCEKYRVFFLTLDWLLFNKGAIQHMEKLPSAGLLHRIHDNPISISNLIQLANSTRIVAFSKRVADWVYETTGIDCQVLTHPPLFFKNIPTGSIPMRRKRRAQNRTNRKWNVTLLGEVRDGKGFEQIIEALGQNEALRSNCVLNLGGGGHPQKVKEIAKLANSVKLDLNIHIHPKQDGDFRGLDDIEFSNLIEETDIMLFPYHGTEAHSMSGHFVDSVFSGSRLLVSDQSAMADPTEHYRLGTLFDMTSKTSICEKLISEICRDSLSIEDEQAAREFQNSYSAESCVKQLAHIMKL